MKCKNKKKNKKKKKKTKPKDQQDKVEEKKPCTLATCSKKDTSENVAACNFLSNEDFTHVRAVLYKGVKKEKLDVIII